MGRAPCCDKAGLKKGPWTPEEDQKLVAYIQRHGHGSWRALPKNAGLLRCGKSCRLRWTNYLRPDIKRGRFSLEEEQMIIQLHAILGNRWSAIAGHLAGRTDNEIKNYWNTHLKKRLMQMGIDPVTHKPRMEMFDPFLEAAGVAAKPLTSSLSHMAQWENARLEAEARLAREYLRFAASSRGGHVLQQPQQQLWNADDARRQFGGEQQQQLWEVESSQQPMQFASDLASQLYASSSSRFDQSPTSTLCSLEGSSPSRSQTMGGLLSGSSCDSGALFHEGVAAPPRGAFGEECDGAAASGLFWSCNTKEELVIPGLSPASTIGDSELLNSSSSSRQQQDEGSPYTTTSTLEMLFDPLVDADGGCKSEQQPPLAVLEWPDVGPAHSKDYWSNVLKLVGSPVSSA